jgi:hypothetical protein
LPFLRHSALCLRFYSGVAHLIATFRNYTLCRKWLPAARVCTGDIKVRAFVALIALIKLPALAVLTAAMG